MARFVKADLEAYDGGDPDAPIYMAIQGIVFGEFLGLFWAV
jgi:predicted heme/steroid binding protein